MHLSSCLNPQTIRNPYTKEMMVVPCGKCAACASRRSGMLQERLKQERQVWKYAYFFTLTYDKEHLPLLKITPSKDYFFDPTPLRCHNKLSAVTIGREELYKASDTTDELKVSSKYVDFCDIHYHGIPYLSTVDCQRFMKRLRTNIQTSLTKSFLNEKFASKVRYFITGEYGPTTFRPHYHGLLFFNSDWLATNIQAIFNKSWKYGSSYISAVQSDRAIGYVSAYLNSYSNLPSILKTRKIRPFALYSKHPALGSLVFPSEAVAKMFLEGNLTQILYDKQQNLLKSIPLWRFFLDKLYPRLSGFVQFPDNIRAQLYRFGASESDFITWRTSVITSKQSTIKSYLSWLRDTPGSFEAKLQRWFTIVHRTYWQAIAFGLSHTEYIKKLFLFYENLRKNNLNLWYNYIEDYSVDHPLDSFGIDPLFIRNFMDCNDYELTASEYYYLQSFVKSGFEFEKFFSKDLPTKLAYQASLSLSNSLDFVEYKENSEIRYKMSTKTKRKNEYIFNEDSFHVFLDEFDNLQSKI